MISVEVKPRVAEPVLAPAVVVLSATPMAVLGAAL